MNRLNTNSEGAIGIFDSGLGGLTVASAVAERLADENIVYLGDTARVPYGTRSPATVVRYAPRITLRTGFSSLWYCHDYLSCVGAIDPINSSSFSIPKAAPNVGQCPRLTPSLRHDPSRTPQRRRPHMSDSSAT